MGHFERVRLMSSEVVHERNSNFDFWKTELPGYFKVGSLAVFYVHRYVNVLEHDQTSLMPFSTIHTPKNKYPCLFYSELALQVTSCLFRLALRGYSVASLSQASRSRASCSHPQSLRSLEIKKKIVSQSTPNGLKRIKMQKKIYPFDALRA